MGHGPIAVNAGIAIVLIGRYVTVCVWLVYETISTDLHSNVLRVQFQAGK